MAIWCMVRWAVSALLGSTMMYGTLSCVGSAILTTCTINPILVATFLPYEISSTRIFLFLFLYFFISSSGTNVSCTTLAPIYLLCCNCETTMLLYLVTFGLVRVRVPTRSNYLITRVTNSRSDAKTKNNNKFTQNKFANLQLVLCW